MPHKERSLGRRFNQGTYTDDRVAKRAVQRQSQNKGFHEVEVDQVALAADINSSGNEWYEANKGVSSFAEIMYAPGVPVNKYLLARRRIPDFLRKATAVSSRERQI